MKQIPPDTQTTETVNEARQAERRKGMPFVLGISVAAAVIALSILMTLYLV